MIINCDDCILKLTCKDYRRPQVYGNLFSNNLIVIPYIDSNKIEDDKGVKEILQALNSSTGGDTLDLCIIPMLQCCPNNIQYEVVSQYYVDCLKRTLAYYKIQPKKNILLCGIQSVNLFMTINDIKQLYDTCFTVHGQHIVITYSPRIKFIDDNKSNIFTNHLIKWYNAAINNDFSMYNMI